MKDLKCYALTLVTVFALGSACADTPQEYYYVGSADLIADSRYRTPEDPSNIVAWADNNWLCMSYPSEAYWPASLAGLWNASYYGHTQLYTTIRPYGIKYNSGQRAFQGNTG